VCLFDILNGARLEVLPISDVDPIRLPHDRWNILKSGNGLIAFAVIAELH